jgi:hypothetical protein
LRWALAVWEGGFAQGILTKLWGSEMDRLKAIGAVGATLITGALVVWWLILAADRLGTKPVVENGSVSLDEWGRARDILTVLLPLFSATIAYWVGSQGTTDAKNEAASAKAKLDAVIDSGPEGMLVKAKQQHPDAFSSGE